MGSALVHLFAVAGAQSIDGHPCIFGGRNAGGRILHRKGGLG